MSGDQSETFLGSAFAKAGSVTDSADAEWEKETAGGTGLAFATETNIGSGLDFGSTTSSAASFASGNLTGTVGSLGANFDVAVTSVVSVLQLGNVPPDGGAVASVFDPVNFERVFEGEDTLVVSYSLLEDFLLQATEPGGSASTSFFAKSTVNGYESLFDLTLSVSGDALSVLDVTFASNPLLGLNDAKIETDILSIVGFDATSQEFGVLSNTSLFSLGIPLAADIDSASVSFGVETQASLPGVPLPSSMILLLSVLGISPLLRRNKG
jgi:hypothetical protein